MVDGERRARIEAALQRGLDFILRAQIRVNGVLTAWCAQHDPITYEPREGRSYEHPSSSGSESVGILAYLISLPNPSPAVRTALSAALTLPPLPGADGPARLPVEPRPPAQP